ncbi:MAG: hypothetical protein ACPGNV_14995 [Mangrovicoccus sp.]
MTSQERPILQSAAELRQHMADLQAEKARLLQAKRHKAEEAARSFADDFVHNSLSEDERQEVLAKIRHAVDNGQLEVLVMRFPSRLCSDQGRAINNNLDNWPETLPGKARDLYEAWLERGKPAGYRLRVMIIDFPGGMPGDVGMFINWAE